MPVALCHPVRPKSFPFTSLNEVRVVGLYQRLLLAFSELANAAQSLLLRYVPNTFCPAAAPQIVLEPRPATSRDAK
jgi:hypothetical protein